MWLVSLLWSYNQEEPIRFIGFELSRDWENGIWIWQLGETLHFDIPYFDQTIRVGGWGKAFASQCFWLLKTVCHKSETDFVPFVPECSQLGLFKIDQKPCATAAEHFQMERFSPLRKTNSNLNLRRGSQSWGSSFNAAVLPWWLLVTRVWNKLTSNSYQQAGSSTRKSHACHDVMGQKPSTFREVGDGSVAPVRHPSVFSMGSQLLGGATGMWQVWWGFCDAKDPE